MAQMTAHAKRMFGDALDQIQSTFAKQDTSNFSSTFLRDVYDAAVEIDNKLATKGRVRNLLRLRPFFDGVERYSKAMDPLCNGTPFLPWIWVLF